MRTTLLTFITLFLILTANAQKKETPNPSSKYTCNWGAFGGPKISWVNPLGKSTIMIGGQGGVTINKQFTFGGFGQGMAGRSNFEGQDYGYDQTLGLSMGYGGVFLEYSPFSHWKLHPTFTLPIGFGGASVKAKDAANKIAKTNLMSVSPRFGLDFNVQEHARLSVFAGYNFIKTNSNFLIKDSDLSSWEIGLCVKLGSF